jgi:hypothetical protein
MLMCSLRNAATRFTLSGESSCNSMPRKDVAAIVLRFGLSDGRKFSGALPLGTIEAVVGIIEEFVRQAAERVEQSEAMPAR